MTTRRQFLSLGCGSIVMIAGCVSAPGDSDDLPTEETPIDETPTETSTDDVDIQNPVPTDDDTLTSWDENLDCNNGTDEEYHAQKREVSVIAVVDEIGSEYKPIPYTSLSTEQKHIIAPVIANGGFATCESSDAFNSFLSTAYNEYGREQEADAMTIYLEYDGRYYQLYLQKQDQVYAA